MSYNAEELNNMKVEELKKIASSMKIAHSKVLKRDLIQRILSASVNVESPSASPSRSRSRSRSSSVLSESMLKSKTASELRKIIIDNKDLYNCAATKISGDKSGKELMINIILDKIKCPREYRYDRSPSPKRSPSPAKKKSPSRKTSPSPVKKKSPSRKTSPSPVKKKSPSRKRSPSPAKKKSPSRKRSPSPSKKKSFSREELEKMTQKQLVELVKNMGLDDICKISVAKPVLVEYILNEDCQIENRKKGKEKIERVKKVKPTTPPQSPPLSPRKDEEVYNEKDLEKMNQKQLVEIVKNMGLDEVCKISVTKPELIKYILNKDCDKKNRKKGKENVVLRPTSPKEEKMPSPKPSAKKDYEKDELERMTTKELTEIVKKKGLDEKCKLAVPKSVLISYIIKNDCQKEYIKKGYKEEKEETPYQKLSKLSDEEIRDILRVYDLDEICDMNVSRDTLIKYIINKGCPDNLKPKPKVPSPVPSPEPSEPSPVPSPEPSEPSPVPSPEPSEPSPVPSPEPSEPSPVPSPEPSEPSPVPSPREEEPEEESDSDVSSVDEEEEDLEAVNRKKIAEMSRALRECLGFSQKKL
jgi:hypothetical protein